MTKLFYAFSPIVLIFIILSFTGCESTGVSTGEAVIKGRVTDSKTFVQIIGAEITTTPATTTVLSDSLGNFIISGIEAGSYTVTAKKYGYGTKSSTVEVTGSDTSTVAIKMDWLNIYTFNNIVVDEYWQDSSHSAVNIYLGYTTTELDNANKDIQLRDSSGTSSNFFFRSGDLAIILAGKETKFSDPMVLNGISDFSKANFDTLTKFNTVDGLFDETRDFPNDRTPYFNDPLTTHYIFALYLKGRNFLPPTYALMYLESAYRDDKFHVKIDLKVNRNGLNLFNPNN